MPLQSSENKLFEAFSTITPNCAVFTLEEFKCTNAVGTINPK